MDRLLCHIFPDILWKMPPTEPTIYLTFDDGPHPTFTPQILDILSEYQAKATFFVTGRNTEKYPNTITRIKEQGHTIGTHSHSHRKMLWLSCDVLEAELLRPAQKIREITGDDPLYFRPPHGYFTPSLIRHCKRYNFRMVLWNLMTYDFSPRHSIASILDKIQMRSVNGSIIVFHDGHRHSDRTIRLLPFVLEFFRETGQTLLKFPEYSKKNL